MTSGFHPEAFGERLAAIRRDRGFRTTEDLAAAMPGSRVTSAVLRNIESGRKPDITVAALLDLALTLDVSPLALIAPLARPFRKINWPNVSDEVAQLDLLDLERLFSGMRLTKNPDEYAHVLAALRSLRSARASRRMIHRDLELYLLDPSSSRLADLEDPEQRAIETIERLDGEIRSLEEFLRARDVDPEEPAS